MTRTGKAGRGAWDPPRGPRKSDGSWAYTLRSRAKFDDREWNGETDDELEWRAVEYYRAVIGALQARKAVQGLTVRSLANVADLSLSVTNAALTGSAWPRWPTLEALAAALDVRLEVDKEPNRPVIEVLLELDFELPRREWSRRGFIVTPTKRRRARRIGMRPNTYIDLAKPGRAPSSATVLAVAAVNQRAVRVVDA